MLRRLFRTNPSPRHGAPARARIVQSLAGLAAGVRQTRRGSFLIMVVGTLALLAVITVIYVSVGRADSQTSAAATKFTERDDVPDAMRDYLAGIIAADLFDTVYLRERDQAGAPIFRREAWDYPSSPFRAVLPDAGGTGDTPATFVTVGDGTDPRFWFNPTGDLTGTDPWLASSRPTLLNIAKPISQIDPTRYYLERVDWMHLSNVAPDGMPVNLWNLRDKGWDATPWEMRENLTLFEDPNLGRITTPDYSDTAAEDPTQPQARPFEWDSRQVAAFHPEVDPDYEPRQFEHMLYQYADADGDGFLDSRWFEMVLARDPANPQDAGWLIEPDRLRYFFAVRVEDLSGRVNVNTATDSTLAPAMTEPYGFTPAAVDLRRALTLEDTYADLNMQFGYDALEQPKGGNSFQDYSAYDQDAAFTAGERAYDAVRIVLDTGTLPPRGGLDGLAVLTDGAAVDREFAVAGAPNTYWTSYWKLQHTSDATLSPNDYYKLFGGFGAGGGAGMLGAADPYSGVGRGFAPDSLLELLRYRGVNDGSERSPLEAAIGGRGAILDPVDSDPLDGFSPLRDNRSTPLERDGRFTLSKGGATFDDDAKAASAVDVRQILTTHSGARPIYSTTIPEDPANPGYPSVGALDIDESDLRENIVELLDDENVQKIFQLYADALLPYSADNTHWSIIPGAMASDTLYYGYRGPELALRTAAHMAVNLMDAYDNTNLDNKKPTARKLIAVEGKTSTMPELRLLDDRLAVSPADVLSPAVTVFGIEAQPFVTGAASYVMYTDAPQGAGGDSDGDADGDPNNGSTPITIEGDIEADNEDFLFQCIAFQIHNPFNRSIDLTADAGQHYVQYGDKFFKLVDVDNGDAAISLGARTKTGGVTPNTRVAYYVDPDPQTIAERWANVTGGTPGDELIRFNNWVQAQFGEGAFRVECHTDATFGTDVATYLDDLLQDGAFGGIVHLYRDDPDLTDNVLVDRLRDPERADSLDRTLPSGNHDIDGADEDFEGDGGDNDGLTITRYASMRRSDDPRGNSTEDPPLGALPAYCVESKSQSYLGNVLDTDGSAEDGLKISDFTKDPQGDRTADGAIVKQSDEADPDSRLAPAVEIPEDRGSDGMSKDTMRGNRDQRPFEGSAEFPPLYVEPHLNNREFGYDTDGDGESDVSTMRVADVLLPLGIGPHYSMEEGWTTLSEALAYALNYDDPGDPNGQDYKGTPLPPSIYANAIDPPPGNHADDPDIRLLDTGLLRPDGFSPFFDRNMNGRLDPAFDRPWGAGVPMVAALLDRITTVPATYGSLHSPTHGLVNINTAPREVVRLLPGLSPPPATDPFGDQLWWWGAGAPHDSESDIATTLVAFRDHLLLWPRDLGAGNSEPINFRDWFDDPNDPANSARTRPPQGGFPPGYDPGENSRRGATGIPVVREGLGFHSLGEITYLRDWAFPTGATPYPHDIDRLGFDGVDVDHEGVDPMTYDTDGDGIPDASGDDEIEDDFDERLALASAVMNSASVRSDFFAVWFVMHGYSETDVSGLRADDPLIPTVARRFVMVVDRSNVTEPGQKPRIVLFKEVPL